MPGEVLTLVHPSIKMHFYLAATHSKSDSKGRFKTLKSRFFESWCKGEAACSGPWNSGDSGMQKSRQYLPSTMAIIFQPQVRATTSPWDQLSKTSLPEYNVSRPPDRVRSRVCRFSLHNALTMPVSILHAAGKARGEEELVE